MSTSTNWRDEDDIETPDWPEPTPLPSELRPVEPFREDLLPVSFRGWVTDIAERLQCPPDFPAVSAIVVLAGIIGRKVGLKPQRRTPWLVVPNLWGFVVGRPGLLKTPSIQEAMKVLSRFETDAKSDFDAAAKEHESAATIAKLQRMEIERKIKVALKSKGDIDRLT